MNEIVGLIIFFGILFLIMYLVGLYLRNLFNKVSKEKCYFCNKELGKDYLGGKCSYKDLGKEILWSHGKCIPKEELKQWKKTQ